MARPSKYPSELRERAVRLVIEVRGDHPSESAAITNHKTQIRPGGVLGVEGVGPGWQSGSKVRGEGRSF